MNIIRLRYIPYTLSLLLILFSIYFIVTKGLPFSTDFKGGTTINFATSQSEDSIQTSFESGEFTLKVEEGGSYILENSAAVSEEQLNDIIANLSELDNFQVLTTTIVSPVVGQDLILKTLIAVGVSILVIFAFVAYSFKSVTASIAAVIAMLHDTFILTGFFAYFGYTSSAKIDLLFVTALLTVLSFSLYDTIVIFDRVRENYKTTSGDYYHVLDLSVKQTMVRSINNSITSMLVLFSLALFVTGSLFWFSVALLIGVILGTYSSPFVAVPVFYDITRLTKALKSKKAKKTK